VRDHIESQIGDANSTPKCFKDISFIYFWTATSVTQNREKEVNILMIKYVGKFKVVGLLEMEELYRSIHSEIVGRIIVL
jgi:hypothetical protein